MYFVNRSEIEDILNFFDDVLSEISQTENFSDSQQKKFAFERMAHVLIEAVIDVGNRMIDGFIMRDPGSYTDIIDILIDEKVLPVQEEAAYKSIIQLRKIIVQQYIQIDGQRLEKTIRSAYFPLSHFSKHIRTYLDNELGVANAFSNENK